MPVPASLTVLVVDDDAVARAITSAQLGELGHGVRESLDGTSAVDAVAAGGNDLVLMDRRLPGLDGPGAARAIRELAPPAGDVPILALSASDEPADVQACLDAGMDGYLVKPVTTEELAEAIVALVETGRLPGAAAAPPPRRMAPEGRAHAAAGATDATDILAVLTRLEGELGARGPVQRAALAFVAQAPRWLDEMAATEDLEARSRAAHGLKGAARTLGATRVADAAEAIEHDPASGPAWMEELRARVAEATVHLAAYAELEPPAIR